MFQEMPPLPSPAVASAVAPAGPRWRARDLVRGAALLALGYAAVIAIAATRGDPARAREPSILLALAVVTLLFEAWIGLVVVLLARWRGLSWGDLGLRRRPGWGLVAFAVCGAYAAVFGYALLIAAIEAVTGSDLSRLREGNAIPASDAHTALVWATLGVAVIVAAPICEELFFRALVFRAVAALRGPVAGIAASGLAFALVHFNVSVVLPFAVVGMIFAWSYRASGSLWTTVAAHAIFNGVSFAATVIGAQR